MRAKTRECTRVTDLCTCEAGGKEKCSKVWYCCDCGREMRHRFEDLFARCSDCSDAIYPCVLIASGTSGTKPPSLPEQTAGGRW